MSSDWLSAIMSHAKHDEHGHVVVAFLRKQDQDVWDSVVVGGDLQPLVFWAKGAPKMEDAVMDAEGNVLMVVLSTPPGVEPGGLMAVPCDATGSPLGSIVEIVTATGRTNVRPASQGGSAPPAPPMGPAMLRTLLEQAAAHNEDGYYAMEVPTADGGSTRVLRDWTGQPLRLWINMPGEQSSRELMVIVTRPDGLVGMAVDSSLRPLHSAA